MDRSNICDFKEIVCFEVDIIQELCNDGNFCGNASFMQRYRFFAIICLSYRTSRSFTLSSCSLLTCAKDKVVLLPNNAREKIVRSVQCIPTRMVNFLMRHETCALNTTLEKMEKRCWKNICLKKITKEVISK